jgi:hypothetical protein
MPPKDELGSYLALLFSLFSHHEREGKSHRASKHSWQ